MSGNLIFHLSSVSAFLPFRNVSAAAPPHCCFLIFLPTFVTAVSFSFLHYLDIYFFFFFKCPTPTTGHTSPCAGLVTSEGLRFFYLFSNRCSGPAPSHISGLLFQDSASRPFGSKSDQSLLSCSTPTVLNRSWQSESAVGPKTKTRLNAPLSSLASCSAVKRLHHPAALFIRQSLHFRFLFLSPFQNVLSKYICNTQ